ncbi:ferredoxin [Mesobacterium sp. TK19101]|uniref:Ferredoxin n=1 Tax=Mesobacterium hydrothermale TaxID=3111907 RepID=A0ABU6HHN7_9RHOB|nr:ferredoxin [Mesobacterium sp. TK19101]MEC3861426.1 ferredoxin [Mesobacterium sp. TK19101]
MTALAALDDAAAKAGLRVRGVLEVTDSDGAPEGCASLVLLGPDEPAFWPLFSTSDEYFDGNPDPLDRWSKRVIGALAREWGGHAVFPSDGPPYPPFIAWARDSDHAWVSPVGLLVHDAAGLFISYRGAVALPQVVQAAPVGVMPCLSCHAAPCTTACPVGALSLAEYDVAACKAHLRSDLGHDCRDNGCLARRACPVAVDFERLPVQSAFHMAAFLGTDPCD